MQTRFFSSAPAHVPARAGSFYCSFLYSFVSPDMGGGPFKAAAVKTVPAAAVCIAFSRPPQLSHADALFQAHPPISRLTPVYLIQFFFRIRGNTRAQACGNPCAACPCNGHGISRLCACRRCRRTLCTPATMRLSSPDCLSL